ncbi:MAG: SUMF1/EgtB/PvdO family nonheme iron enzyme, partial [Candidatus Cloacimonetes bacterium]|nr:SUMF1/EgtB/PvdO family nonheme iron enzyme [Candidatus Cloacimonadota bacterium]
YSGSNILVSVGWCSNNSNSKTHLVGGKKPNELGLYDMSGNVSEWCNDLYEDYYSAPQTNPQGSSSGSYRVLRGGNWKSGNALFPRVSCRDLDPQDENRNDLGFRLVLVP